MNESLMKFGVKQNLSSCGKIPLRPQKVSKIIDETDTRWWWHVTTSTVRPGECRPDDHAGRRSLREAPRPDLFPLSSGRLSDLRHTSTRILNNTRFFHLSWRTVVVFFIYCCLFCSRRFMRGDCLQRRTRRVSSDSLPSTHVATRQNLTVLFVCLRSLPESSGSS